MRILLALILITALQSCSLDSFLFNTQKQDHYALPGNTIPDSLLERVTLTSDGNKIYGIWVKGDSIFKQTTILYCHGNKHSIDEYWHRVMIMHKMGFNVFIFDYRGYGMSEGTSSEQGLYKDAEAALDYISNQKQIPIDSLCIYGYSLGNVASIYLSSKKVNPLCLIAESPFASANSLTQSSVGLDLPSYWLTDGNFNNQEAIKNIHTPLLLLHGEDDDFVRYIDNGKLVYENAPNPKKLLLIPKANHTNIIETMSDSLYMKAISDWILLKK